MLNQLPFLQQAEDILKNKVSASTNPNSLMPRAAADRMIDLVVDVSTLLKMVDVQRTDKARGVVTDLDLPSIVVEGAHSTSTATRRGPTERTRYWDVEKYRAAIDLDEDFLEDNIEGPRLRDKILNMFAKQIASNMELAAILGDESLTVGDSQTDENNLLGVNDGWKVILDNEVPATRVVDAASTGPSSDLFFEMKRRIPSKFRVLKPAYKLFLSNTVSDLLAYNWHQRATNMGDTAGATGQDMGTWGIPTVEVHQFPEDLTATTGGGTDTTFAWLTPPENLRMYIRRDWKVEFERKARGDYWESTMHFRCDVVVVDPDMVVTAINIDPAAAAFTR